MTEKLIPIVLILLVSACGRHAVDEVAEIAPNETAFLIAMDGDTKTNQVKFGSIEALQQNKIAAKRVIIPHKLLDLCPSCLWRQNADVPTARLIKINRAPVTREWTATDKGTAKSNQAISVETNESIDFDVGAILTAHIDEEDAAKFLYFYSGRQLADIIDTDIRSFVSQSISSQFGRHSIDEGRREKIQYFDTAKQMTADFFKDRGISIDSLGMTEGMNYHDKRIQDAINKKFEAEQQTLAAKDLAQAAAILAANKDAVLMQQNLELRKIELDNQKAAISKWDGHMPYVAGSEGMIFNLPLIPGK